MFHQLTAVSGQGERLVDIEVSAIEEDRLGHGVPPVLLWLRHEQALSAAGAQLPPLGQ